MSIIGKEEGTVALHVQSRKEQALTQG